YLRWGSGGRRGRVVGGDRGKPGYDLRGHGEVRIGGRLPGPVLEPRGAVPMAPAEHAEHHPAIVPPPDHAVGRQRIGAIALVAVDGRGGEGSRRARMDEKPR